MDKAQLPPSVAPSPDRPFFQLLSDAQLRDIHEAALVVLADVGGRVYHQQAVDMLRRAGCRVSDGNLMALPRSLVEDCVASAPSRIVLHRRDGSAALYLEGNNTYFGTGSDLPNVIDLETGEPRPALLADVESMARVVDALANIDFVMSMALPSDVPPLLSDRYAYRAMVANTVKPIVYTAWDEVSARDVIAMAEAVAGGEEALRQAPTLLAYLEPSSPLKHSEAALAKLIFLAGKGLPFMYSPGAITGATAPATIGGALAQCTAEVLTGLVLGQLARRGAPFLWGSSASPLDMRSMTNPYVAPEDMLHNTAMAELAHRFYKLPVWGFAGCSDSKVPDLQAGAEGAMWVAVAALAGNNLVHDSGYLESGLTGSYEMLLAMDDSIGLFRRFLGGLNLTPADFALDTIAAVGPGGHYLDSDLTLQHFRGFWRPRWFDHQKRDRWAADGALDASARLRLAAKRLLAEHVVPPLPATVSAALDGIVAAAARR
ncbi:MAG: trimethylamine methyltransferase family protein [Anaerolineae bacterium]